QSRDERASVSNSMLVPERGAPRMMTGSLITPGRLLDVAERAQVRRDASLVLRRFPPGRASRLVLQLVAHPGRVKAQEVRIHQRREYPALHATRHRQPEEVQRGRGDRLDRVLPLASRRANLGAGEEVDARGIMGAREAELLEGPEEGASAQIASHALVDDAEARIADRDDVRRLRDVGSAVGLLTAADLGEDPPPPGVAGTFEPVDDVVADGLVLPALQDAAERVAAGNVDPDARGARFEGLRPRARARHVDHPVGGIVEGAAGRRDEPADEA